MRDNKAWYQKNKERLNVKSRAYYQKNKEELKALSRKYYQEHREEIIPKLIVRARRHRKEHREYYLRANQKVKEQVLIYYGGGKLACVKCGFSDVRALTIDHINNDGFRERQAKWKGGVHLCYALRGRGFPKGYQTLCFNCQWIKELERRTSLRLDKLKESVGKEE